MKEKEANRERNKKSSRDPGSRHSLPVTTSAASAAAPNVGMESDVIHRYEQLHALVGIETHTLTQHLIWKSPSHLFPGS